MSGLQPFGTMTDNKNVQTFIADDRWSPENQNIFAKYPRLTIERSANNSATSTYWERDGAFLKLKNAEIGYTFKSMRLYLRGSNLLTFSKFKLWDPEQGGGNGLKYPTQRVFNIGFQIDVYKRQVYTMSAPNFLHIRRKAGSVTSSMGASRIGCFPKSIWLIFIYDFVICCL